MMSMHKALYSSIDTVDSIWLDSPGDSLNAAIQGLKKCSKKSGERLVTAEMT